ncbi:hypothetical protein [Bifidobacterium apri]|uniref:Uncharacterized protein n=1 Tax=Bifidobacterium apri TaxID=1769423 RepID=A0A6A2V6H9_9BIFI|nr:hypothetical protein [Bifidobacterium apri]KAB8291891.1 hypothetical protein DSM100238_1831 [Bifidobacterium apri]
MRRLTERQKWAKFWFCLVLGVALLTVAGWAAIWFVWGVYVMHVFGVMEAVITPIALLFGITFTDIARKA